MARSCRVSYLHIDPRRDCRHCDRNSVSDIDERSAGLVQVLAFEIRRIENAPTIEAEPIRHGEWIAINNPSYSPFDGSEPRKYICSGCKSVIPHARAYCSECGSKNDKIVLERSEAMREMKMDGAALGGEET